MIFSQLDASIANTAIPSVVRTRWAGHREQSVVGLAHTEHCVRSQRCHFIGHRFLSDGGGAWRSLGTFNGVRVSAVPATGIVVTLAAGLGPIGMRLRRRR